MFDSDTGNQYGSLQMDYSLLVYIREYINDEMIDSRYYSILASKAPTLRARDLLIDFSREEQAHAQSFMKVYYAIAGTPYCSEALAEPEVPEYIDALKDRILSETIAYKKYCEEYMKAKKANLKDLFFTIGTDEAQHAMRIPLLMAENCTS